MAKYFFKRDGNGFLGNPNGTELPNVDAAREYASALVQIFAEDADLFESWSICVMDESERPVMTIAFPSSLCK
jgi:hypothetical protein